MKRLLPVLLLLAVALASSCDDAESSYSSSPSPSPERAAVLIDTGDDVVFVKVDVADSPEERAVGLMNHTSLEEDEGMLFVFFEESTGGFWMKDTEIPLSIAFFDQRGEIISIQDMDPCLKEPCPSYDPGSPYWGALEVNQGAFEKWGVSEGDILRSNQ